MSDPEHSPAHARADAPSLVRGGLGVLIALGVLALLARAAALPLGNADTYFHLRFGREFLDGWSLRDPGSIGSFASEDWLPTQWLPQVLMAWLEERTGLAGVAWLSGLLFLSLASTVYWACRSRSEPIVAALLTLVTMAACIPGMSMRPQQLSYIFVVLTTVAWLRARDTGRAPWVLIPLTYVWTMCHGMWPVGIVIGVGAVVGIVLDRQHDRRSVTSMLAVPVASALVALVTPAGPGLFGAVLTVNGRSEYFYEWASPDFTRPYSIALLVLLAIAVAPRARSGPVPWFDLAMMGLAALWALYSLRTVPVAACMAAPLAAAGVQSLLGVRPRVHRAEIAVMGIGFVTALTVLAVAVPVTADQPRERLSGLDGALADLPDGTTVIGDSAFGGYLLWRFPELDVAMHGYGDVFTDAELERISVIEEVDAGWAEEVREIGAQYAAVEPESPLAYNLRELESWTVLAESDEYQLLEAPAGWPGS
jgi:hypothetical protein